MDPNDRLSVYIALEQSLSPGEMVQKGIDLVSFVAATDDVAVLKRLLDAAVVAGDLRWRVRLSDRLFALNGSSLLARERVRLRIWANDMHGAEHVLASLPKDLLSPPEISQIRYEIAERSCTDVASIRHALSDMAQTGLETADYQVRTLSFLVTRGHLKEASELLASLKKGAPASPDVLSLEIRLRMLQEGPLSALSLLDRSASDEKLPHRLIILLRVPLLCALGRWQEALDVGLSAGEETFQSAAIWPHLFSAAVQSDQVERLRQAAEEVHSRYPKLTFLNDVLFDCSLEEGDTETTSAKLAGFGRSDGWKWIQARFKQACYAGDHDAVVALLEVARQERAPLSPIEINFALFAYYFGVDRQALWDSVSALRRQASISMESVGLHVLLLRILIALERASEAEAYFRELPPGLHAASELVPFKLYFEVKNGGHVEAAEGWRRWLANTMPMATEARASYPEPVALRFSPDGGEVLCFVVVFNGIEYVEWFLEYYRALGVDHFFFCDNGSTDGTFEVLAAQHDVSLFSAKGSFAAAACGIFWINHLMRTYGCGHWCLHVDIDEAFVYPLMESGRSLQDLLSYFDANGFAAAAGQMIDMFPTELASGEKTGRGESDFRESCFFDTTYSSMPCELPPYRFVKGGIRSILTGRTLLMTKSPIVRMHADFAYLANNHQHTHVPLADVSTAVLHYKFIGNYASRFEEAVARREHFQGAKFYRELQESIEHNSHRHKRLPVEHYRDTAQLTELGLLESSPGWKAWDYEAKLDTENGGVAYNTPRTLKS